MSKKTGKFFLGALVGAAIGLLFAPKKGSETREELKAKLDDLLQKAKDVSAEDVKETVEAKIEQIKAELEDLDKEKVLKIAKKKARTLERKCEDLVDYAVEKGTPVLEDASKKIKEKAAVVIKNVLDKLEEE